jgi:hypothetical protein
MLRRNKGRGDIENEDENYEKVAIENKTNEKV